MSVLVRDAEPGDLPWIADLVRTSFDSDLLPYLVAAQHGILEWWRLMLDYPASFGNPRILVATSADGTRLGYAEVRKLDETTGFLSYVAVSPQARGAGIARGLLAAWLRDEPAVGAMELDVFASNAPARRLYERLGFEETARSTWWTAPLPDTTPDPAAGDLAVVDLPAAMARHRVYGFTDLAVGTGDGRLRLGVMGQEVLRFFSANAFADDRAVALGRSLFPDLTRGMAILAAGDAPPAQVGAEPVNESLRMRSVRIRQRLEHP